MSFNFGAAFKKKLGEKPQTYSVRGIVTADRRVYPLGTDSKVLSTIFEAVARPIIYEIAEENGFVVHEAQAQNSYPDFTLMKDKDDKAKIAVDVKSTYCDKPNQRVSFTLGGYTSFIRDPCKSIEFPYGHYAEEWVLGYIYQRKKPEDVPAHIYEPILKVLFDVHDDC